MLHPHNVLLSTASKTTLLRGRRVFILLCYMPESSFRGFRLQSTSTPCTLIWPVGETKPTTVTRGSFRKAGRPWARLSSRATSNKGYLVCHGAKDVEDQVIDKQRRPWPDGDDAQEQLK
jgi:hypothetical protein